ncbi:phage tail protein [Gryllotalpicola protaetiae]|uniref:phage tail tube protein n=1 Tax=Gryllotalpicola protaetiae TaxID=2419771 RepID=UPI0015E89C50|nr:phage tail protein [Gryllotalpicola protaetiae]
MANSVENVFIGKPGGGISVAPLGGTVPTNATDALPSGFDPLGYISEDGYTNTVDSDTDTLGAWGGDVVATLFNGDTETFTFTAIEINPVVLKQVYGPSNVTVVGDTITALHNSIPRPHASWVFETLYNGRVKRDVVPDGQITDIGDIVNQDGDAVGFEITVTAYPDADGNRAYTYIAKVEAEPESLAAPAAEPEPEQAAA